MFVDSGKTWALPAGLDPQVVYFNKDYFDKRGVPYPDANWTRDDFQQKVLKFRNPATGTFGYAIASDFLDPILFVYQHGGRLFDDLQDPTRTTFTDPKTVEAVEWYAKLLEQEGAVLTPQVAQGLGMGNLQNALRAGKSAMWIGPLSARGGRLDRAPWPFKWGMAPLPRDTTAATMATATGYTITTQCKKSLACWQFISFLSKQAPGSFAPARQIVGEVRCGSGCRGRQDRPGIRRQLADDPGRRSCPAIKGHRCLHRGRRRGCQRESLGSRGDDRGAAGVAVALTNDQRRRTKDQRRSRVKVQGDFKGTMSGIRLIHWNAAEAAERARAPAPSGVRGVIGYAQWSRLPEAAPPGAAARCGDRPEPPAVAGPRHGRTDPPCHGDASRPTRLRGGHADKIAQAQAVLPDATFTTWERIGEDLAAAIANPPAQPVVPESTMAGYSGQPLVRKLGIKPGMRIALFAPPEGFGDLVGELPPGATFQESTAGSCGLAIWFVRSATSWRAT